MFPFPKTARRCGGRLLLGRFHGRLSRADMVELIRRARGEPETERHSGWALVRALAGNVEVSLGRWCPERTSKRCSELISKCRTSRTPTGRPEWCTTWTAGRCSARAQWTDPAVRDVRSLCVVLWCAGTYDKVNLASSPRSI